MKFVVVLCLVVAILADASAKKGWKKKFKELEKKFNILYSKVHAQQQDIQECCNKTDSFSYNYRDEMAQTYCTSKRSGKHVFAVRRDCGGTAPSCNDLCGPNSVLSANLTSLNPYVASLGPTECFDGFHIWTNHPMLAPNPGYHQPDAGQLNMISYGYGAKACTWKVDHCGPNYCCCSTAVAK